jgi:hypothetical protein
VVSRDKWTAARKELLEQEKQLIHARDAVNEQAPGPALGQSRQGICLRDSRWKEDPCRTVRRRQSAHRVSLHVEA